MQGQNRTIYMASTVGGSFPDSLSYPYCWQAYFNNLGAFNDAYPYLTPSDTSLNPSADPCIPILEGTTNQALMADELRFSICLDGAWDYFDFYTTSFNPQVGFLAVNSTNSGIFTGEALLHRVYPDTNATQQPGVQIVPTDNPNVYDIVIQVAYTLNLPSNFPNTGLITSTYYVTGYSTPGDSLVLFGDHTKYWNGNTCPFQNPGNSKSRLGQAESAFEAGVHLSPNPASHRLNIDVPVSEGTEIQFHTAQGQSIHVPAVGNAREGAYTFNIEALPRGIYFVRIQSSEGMVTKKWIKN